MEVKKEGGKEGNKRKGRKKEGKKEYRSQKRNYCRRAVSQRKVTMQRDKEARGFACMHVKTIPFPSRSTY